MWQVRLEHLYPRTRGILGLVLECALLVIILGYMAREVVMIYRMGAPPPSQLKSTPHTLHPGPYTLQGDLARS